MSNIIKIVAARITDKDVIRRAYELRKDDKEFVSALLQNPKLPADVLVKIMGNDQMDKIEQAEICANSLSDSDLLRKIYQECKANKKILIILALNKATPSEVLFAITLTNKC